MIAVCRHPVYRFSTDDLAVDGCGNFWRWPRDDAGEAGPRVHAGRIDRGLAGDGPPELVAQAEAIAAAWEAEEREGRDWRAEEEADYRRGRGTGFGVR